MCCAPNASSARPCCKTPEKASALDPVKVARVRPSCPLPRLTCLFATDESLLLKSLRQKDRFLPGFVERVALSSALKAAARQWREFEAAVRAIVAKAFDSNQAYYTSLGMLGLIRWSTASLRPDRPTLSAADLQGAEGRQLRRSMKRSSNLHHLIAVNNNEVGLVVASRLFQG